MELSEKIVSILEEEGFSIVGEIERNGQSDLFVAELEAYSPLGEDLITDVIYDGTDTGFVEAFARYAENFDEDEHARMWIDRIDCGRGVPSKAALLVKDAAEIKEMLLSRASNLKCEGVEQRNKNRRRAVLRELFDKVKEALDLEPCGCDDEDEQEIWQSINDLSDMLYDYL